MVDWQYDVLFWFSAVSLGAITIGIVVFSHIYARKKKGERTAYIEGHTPTEVGVSIGLFVAVMAIFYWGWIGYKEMRTMPTDALEINVVGRQWQWEFQYANGRKLTNEFTIPLGKKVKLLMTSADVIHSLFIPNFRVKQDVLPNMYTALWFEPTMAGVHDLFCAEYCGTAHSKMLAKVTVMPPEEYERWQLDWELAALKEATEEKAKPKEASAAPAEQGKQLFTAKGCPACHTVDGNKGVGPTLAQVFGRQEEMQDGMTVTVDENYIRESLTEPQAKVVKGFQPIMPTYKGQLKDEEFTALIEYLKGLK
ncbi:MAG: cytochrome c oxidase subunit II [Deltaproteobacteria bacterium]|nr:cytochrome c oxidase subunit II [Deltaproteobacteria bacterium]